MSLKKTGKGLAEIYQYAVALGGEGISTTRKTTNDREYFLFQKEENSFLIYYDLQDPLQYGMVLTVEGVVQLDMINDVNQYLLRSDSNHLFQNIEDFPEEDLRSAISQIKEILNLAIE